MSSRRLLRWFAILLLLLLLGSLWAFSTFLFNPFEGAYEYDLSTLVPREVDFYVAKKDLRDDFDPFPKLAIADEFAASRAGRALQETPAVRDFLAQIELEKLVTEVERALAQLPVQADPLGIFGGKGLALAGTFRGDDLAKADWAVYGRTSRIGKLAFELVDGGWVDLSAQGFVWAELEKDGDAVGFTLSGGTLARPIHLTRLRDVVIVATSPELALAAHGLEAARGENSLGLSAKYGDNIRKDQLTGDELELYLDQRTLAENFKLAGTWPDASAPFLGTALAARLFQIGTLRELIGTLDFGSASSVDLVAELSSNVLTTFQQRLYEERGFDRDQILEVGRLVPADAGLFFYGHGDIGDLLRQVIASVRQYDPTAIDNLEDLVRSVWDHPDIEPWIDDLDLCFRDRFAFFLRDFDYPDEGEAGPPHNDVPVPIWGLILWPEDQERVDRFAKAILQNQGAFGIRGREPGSVGVIDNTLSGMGGAKVLEYWNELVPGTGHIATLEMKGREPYLVVSNHNRLAGQVFKTYHTGGSDFPRLAEQTRFSTWVNAGLANANFLCWLDPRAIAGTNRRIAAHQAQLDVGGRIDWKVERPRIEHEVAAKNFPGEDLGALKEEESFELLVEEEVARFEAQYKQEHAIELVADYERRFDLWEITTGALLELASDRKRLHLVARAGIDLGPAQPAP